MKNTHEYKKKKKFNKIVFYKTKVIIFENICQSSKIINIDYNTHLSISKESIKNLLYIITLSTIDAFL